MSVVQNNELLVDGPVGQLQLLHTVVDNNPSNTTVIICHPHPLYGGTMSNKVVHIINKTFNNAGLNTVRFNFRGVEKSEGEFADAVGEIDDLLSVMSWLKHQSGISSMHLAGFSFGSFIAAQAASQIETPLTIEKLLLIAPPVNMYAFDSIKITMPCLVIQGGQDTVVDPTQVKQWLETQGSNIKLEWNDEAEHFFHGKLNFIRDKVSEHWFK